jgi:hypothetical protein
MDQCIKNKGVHDWLGKHVHDQNWADHDEEKEYVRQEGQRCLGGLTRCQKRRVQRLRNLNISSCCYQGFLPLAMVPEMFVDISYAQVDNFASAHNITVAFHLGVFQVSLFIFYHREERVKGSDS